MMQPTKRDMIRRVIVYTLMVTAVLGLTTALLLAMLGYRYNKNDNVFVQGGLVQFISQPSGASVRVGTADLANRTRSKITLNPGEYKVVMSRDGYRSWEKQITVEAGKLLWLNSARLLPTNPISESIVTAKTITSAAMQENGKYIALMKDASTPTVTLVTANDDTVAPIDVTLPATGYAQADKHRFTLIKQNGDNVHILLKHTFGTSTEWLMMNTDSVNDSYKLPNDEKNTIEIIQFDPSSSDHAFAQYEDGTIRRFDVSDGTFSDVLLRNVSDFSLTSNGSIFYIAVPSKGVTTTGYLSNDSRVPRELQRYDDTPPTHIAGGEYFSNFYIATAEGNTITTTKYETFPRSESDDPLVAEKTYTIRTPSKVTYLSFKNSGRLISAQQARHLSTYDIELEKQSDIPLEGVEKPITEPLQWLDSFHFWNDASGFARQYEFDGTNQESIVAVKPGFPAAYSANNKYFYTINTTDRGLSLQRTRVLL